MNLILPVLILLGLIVMIAHLGGLLWDLAADMLEMQESLHPLKLLARGGALGVGVILLAVLLYAAIQLCRFMATL